MVFSNQEPGSSPCSLELLGINDGREGWSSSGCSGWLSHPGGGRRDAGVRYGALPAPAAPGKAFIYSFVHVQAAALLLCSHSDRNEYFRQRRWGNIGVMDSRQSANGATAAAAGGPARALQTHHQNRWVWGEGTSVFASVCWWGQWFLQDGPSRFSYSWRCPTFMFLLKKPHREQLSVTHFPFLCHYFRLNRS